MSLKDLQQVKDNLSTRKHSTMVPWFELQIDDGAVRVEYQSEQNVFGDDVQLQYKKPLPDEGDPRPTAEFTTAESGPVGRQVVPMIMIL